MIIAVSGAAAAQTPGYGRTARPAAPEDSIPFQIINYNSVSDPIPMCLGTKDGQNNTVAWLW